MVSIATLSLKKWVNSAVGRGDNPLTPTYLASALRIAKCLTEQIGDAEELSKVGLSSGLESLPLPYPYTCLDWADCININYAVVPSEDGASLADVDESNDQTENRTGLSSDKSDLDYHSVLSAEIFASASNLNNNNFSAIDCTDAKNRKLQRIYSLGLALYFLFSGGDLPPPELLVAFVQDQEGGSFSAISINNPRDGDGSISESRDHSVSNKRQSNMSSNIAHSSEMSHTSRVVSNVNLEYLRMKGVPSPLCDLIHNMIDCINGDFVRSETYTDVSEITCDLEFMIDEPEIYLNGVDANELARTGLQFDDTLFERSTELRKLQAAYEKSTHGSRELAVLYGLSGTGKSTIAKQFGKFVTSNGGHFLSYKFDQMREVKEFSPIAAAFNTYIDNLVTNEPDQAQIVAFNLCDALGQDVCYLAHVLPSLQKVIGRDITNVHFDEEYANAHQRQLYLFSKLVDVICKCSKRPLALFVDDIQWADPVSISLIHQVMKTSGSVSDGKQIFFLACYRDDEMQDDHPFWDVYRNICSVGFTDTCVKLDSVDSETMQLALSWLLCLTPRLVNSLSDIIHRKTRGNPLFVTRLLASLNQEGLLRINLVKRRWEWHESSIQARKLPDDVAAFFIQQISSLPADSAAALATISCFGASVSREIVEAMEQNLEMQLADPLEHAIKAGLVDMQGGKYHFSHDRIQEAVYKSIEETNRSLCHMEYGLSLVDVANRTNDDAMFFIAVTQINIGGPSAAPNMTSFATIAEYNISAGKRAMSFNEFSSAFKYFDHGITFLRKNHWRDHYDLTLELFQLAAKCALAINDFTSLTYLCNSVSQRARNFDDTLGTSLVVMTSLIHSKISESVGYGMAILLKLGVCIPEYPQRDYTLNKLNETRVILNKLPNESILSYPVISDYKKVMAMKFLARLVFPTREIRPRLLPLVAIKMINFTVEHGLSSASSVGFALFGGMVAMLGDLREGYRYTELALSLVDKFKNTEVTGEVISVSIHIMSYVEPYSMVKAELTRGLKVSMATGNIHLACINRNIYCFTMFWFGVKLNALKDELDKFASFMQEHRHQTTLKRIQIFQHYVSKLMDDGGQAERNDEICEASTEIPPHCLVTINFQEIFAALVFDKYDDMKKYGEKFKKDRLESWFLMSAYSFQAFVIGLVYYRIFRETDEPIWAEKAKEYQTKVTLWSEQGLPRTFEHRQHLMQAEEAYSNQNLDKAQEMYDSAIGLAICNEFKLDCALACELAAHFHLKTGDTSCAFKYYTKAYWQYVDWGAGAKLKQMEAFSRQTFNAGFPVEADDFVKTSALTRKRELL